MHSELTKIQQELDFAKDQMSRKNDEYQSTIDDLAIAQRTSEDGRLNAIQELESKKYEFTDLQSQLSSTEERLNNLQQEYVKADSDRDSLRDALRRFQNSVSRIMKLNRFRNLDGVSKITC